MPITMEQRQARRHHLGSSDLAALLGVDPWRNAMDVYLDKTGALVEDQTSNMACDLGNLMEPVVLKMAEADLGPLTIPDTRQVDGTVIFVNTDALTANDGEPVEAKTNSIVGFADDEWGEPGTDEVPLRYIIQCHAHMAAWKKDVCHVPVIIGRKGYLLYHIVRNPIVEDTILKEADKFWIKHVLANTPPDNIAPHLEVAKRIRRTPERITEIPAELVQHWMECADERKRLEKEEESAKASILAAMGDAEGATCGPLGAVTYLQQTRAEYICKATSFRVLRRKKGGL